LVVTPTVVVVVEAQLLRRTREQRRRRTRSGRDIYTKVEHRTPARNASRSDAGRSNVEWNALAD
jgi:hypothetical protein